MTIATDAKEDAIAARQWELAGNDARNVNCTTSHAMLKVQEELTAATQLHSLPQVRADKAPARLTLEVRYFLKAAKLRHVLVAKKRKAPWPCQTSLQARPRMSVERRYASCLDP